MDSRGASANSSLACHEMKPCKTVLGQVRIRGEKRAAPYNKKSRSFSCKGRHVEASTENAIDNF